MMAITPQSLERPRVYTVGEVAAALRVSSETIRRKISAGELPAIEITSGPRRQYRILARDLAAWLGPEEARAVFGIGEGLEALRATLAPLSEAERAALIAEAVTWARQQAPASQGRGRTVSPEKIATRFPPPE